MRIGVVGTGVIVETFLDAVDMVSGVKCNAICSRKIQNRVKELSNKYNIQSLYDDYEKMLKSDSIDFVYIALPNSLHYKYSLKALENGKNVICEKPFTSTVNECENLIKLAKDKGLFLFEAITTIHLPNYNEVREKIKLLKDIKLIQCNYSKYSSRYDLLMKGETPNIFNLEFSGGALYDLNIYNLHFVVGLFGEPKDVKYLANIYENGVDTSGIVTLKYDKFLGECIGAKDSSSSCFVCIQATNGYIKVKGPSGECKSLEICINGKTKEYNLQKLSNRMVYEIEDFKKIFENGKKDQCYNLLNHSLKVVKTAFKARKDAKIVFQGDLK